MIDMLKSIGIEKGKRFNPDARTEETLNAAAAEAHAWLDARYEAGFPRYFEGARDGRFRPCRSWLKTSQLFTRQRISTRSMRAGSLDTYAFSSVKHLGAGQFYLMTAKDRDGRALDGAKTYRLRVPANAPVKQYWSAVAYDRTTHALIRDMPAPAAPRNRQSYKRIPTALWTSTSHPKLRRARSRTGFRRSPAVGLKSSSASMVRRSRSSTRPGYCRISRK